MGRGLWMEGWGGDMDEGVDMMESGIYGWGGRYGG